MWRPLLRALLMTMLMVAPCLAQAEQPTTPVDQDAAKSRAKELAVVARQRRAAGDLPGALDLYKQAYAIYPSPYLLWPQAELYLLTDHPDAAQATLGRHEQGFPAGAYPSGQGPAEIQALRDKIVAHEVAMRIAPSRLVPGTINLRRTSTSAQSLLRRIGWGTLGGAALFLASGGIALGVHEQQLGVWNDDATCLTGGFTRQDNCGDHLTTANRAQDAAIATSVIGGALAGTAAVLLIISRPRAEQHSAKLSWACAPATGKIGAYCVRTF